MLRNRGSRRRSTIALMAALATGPGCVAWRESLRALPPLSALPAASATGDGLVRRVAASGETGQSTASANAPLVPVDACIRRALEANAMVRAARHNLEAVRQRIPQVTSLDDPVVSNTIYPVTSVAPQYSLMGYMPYSMLLAQQFPWFGTLRLRGHAAEQDVQVALAELCAAQLDAVEAVKLAYYDLQLAERTESLLLETRALALDFRDLARGRYRTATATQTDVVRADVALADIDREVEGARQSATEARAELARLMHSGPDAELQTVPASPESAVATELDRLYQLAVASRPDLRGRLAAIARDQTAVELARKLYRPNVTLGVAYSAMSERGAMVGQQADGQPNVGMFIGFNLPIRRARLAAGVCEAQARVAADSALYEAERDQSHRDIKTLYARARTLHNILTLLRQTNLPAARQVLELTSNDYRSGNAGVDLLAILTASRDVLQVELQMAQLEAQLGQARASLERAVGAELNEHPPDPSAVLEPPPATPGPFDAGAPKAPAQNELTPHPVETGELQNGQPEQPLPPATGAP